MARPPRIPNWLPWDQSSVYFITFCIERRRPVLANPNAWKVCLRVLDRLNQWETVAAIAMPDHLHLLTAPLDRDASVSEFSKWFQRWFNDAYGRPSVSDGRTCAQRWQWRKAVSIDCFVLMNRFPTNGNTCAKIPSAPAWSASQVIGPTNSPAQARNCNCRASVSDATLHRGVSQRRPTISAATSIYFPSS